MGADALPRRPDHVWTEDLGRRIAMAGEPTADDVMVVPAGVKLDSQQDCDEFITAALFAMFDNDR